MVKSGLARLAKQGKTGHQWVLEFENRGTDHVFLPVPLTRGGTGRAPNPAEYALAALATCQEITYHLHADALGIPLRDVSVRLEGELDLRGFFGAAKGVRPGFLSITGTVTFDSDAPAEELQHLKSVVDAHCPVLDLFNNATPVRIAIAERVAA